jgi:hypothetical protein
MSKRIRVLSYVCDGRPGARPELQQSILAGIEEGADVISGQGNGMDMGPYFLGAGEAGAPPARHNFEAAILGAKRAGIPFVFSLGGRAGADAQLGTYLRVMDDIARESGETIRAAVISGEIRKEYLEEKLECGVKMPRLFETPRLTEHLTSQDVSDASTIQAQMGAEPIVAALRLFDEGQIDGVFTGRALDSGVHMAYPLLRGFPIAGAAHLAKIIECGSMCCDPPDVSDAVLGELQRDGRIRVWPPGSERRCTVKSVAGHAVYERDNPYLEKNPGGVLDVTSATYEQASDRAVSTFGATWEPTPYAVKLEGVKSLGYETAFLAAASDPTLIASIDDFTKRAIEETRAAVSQTTNTTPDNETFKIICHVIGRGALPTSPDETDGVPREVALLARVVAPTQEESLFIATTLRIRLQLGDFPGRSTTAGNFAFPLTKTFLEQGKAFAFNIWHLLPLEDPTEPFPVKVTTFPRN